jgi:hypothetical protein
MPQLLSSDLTLTADFVASPPAVLSGGVVTVGGSRDSPLGGRDALFQFLDLKSPLRDLLRSVGQLLFVFVRFHGETSFDV